jgi:hypothetical protein
MYEDLNSQMPLLDPTQIVIEVFRHFRDFFLEILLQHISKVLDLVSSFENLHLSLLELLLLVQ